MHRDFPQAQILVSYNDPGAPFCDTWIDYLYQKENIGAFANMHAALSAATRKYAVYCADDDYLLPAQVQIGIDYLERHPKCVAYCAPCQIWDEIKGTPFWNAFSVKESRSYSLSDARELFNLIIQSHIWPEHIVYRTPVPIFPRTRAYWAFADLVSILEAGDIYFSNTPFYRNLLVHPVGERVQLGNVQCLTHFDEYRAGLEVLAHGLFGSQLPYKARNKIQEMISSFICARMYVAAQLYAGSGHIEEATMLLQRISIARPEHDVESCDAQARMEHA